MKSALIGYTGFVGSNILKQKTFDYYYNSSNIQEIVNKKYDLVVCAGTYAKRWQANLEPEKDWNTIKKLLGWLKKVYAKHFVLISTIDVYPNPVKVNEDTSIDLKKFTQAYGFNRFKVEEFIKNKFSKVTIIRCPQLFGPNLKKNFVFDLINDNALDFTHKDAYFQWYNLENIWKDITIAIKNNISLINLATDPITAHELAKYTRGIDFTTITKAAPLKFNFQTKYGSTYGTSNNYLYNRKQILEQVKNFIAEERKKLKK